ncbi:MAG: hypothetical protein ACOCYU_00795, partial [Brevefilum sp.]
NVIDNTDAIVVGAWYELPIASYNLDEGVYPNVNCDGIVNIQDLAMVTSNNGLTSEGTYAGWAP